ncbi:MAG: hypothetical protein AVDCRST_MAG77-5790 [uncultured Chloroflexi bacterium]|uniref:Type II secretion system protein GspF domain-containing protein n=1 Tax=uncultured Chloroflexota bacterium TaxID=166587 RepID=A0A6J4KE78_9CHLR|nr:MAG: hypothetical protein AVDCRST_MAG77-5790 [uncultured Chloroflexota bacterium]
MTASLITPLGYLAAALLAAAGMLLVATGAAGAARWRFLDRRIREYVAMDPPPLAPPVQRAAAAASARKEPRTRLGCQVHQRLSGTSLAAGMQARLTRAGSARRASEVLVLQAVLALSFAGVTWLLVRGLGPAPSAVLTVLLGAAGGHLPVFVLNSKAAARQVAFERQLPQAIDALASSLQAGSTLPQAMAVLAREMAPPLAVEFRRVLRETEVGLGFPDALAGLLARVPSSDLMLFIGAVSIQHRVGGDLAQIFRGISHTIRERIRVRGEMNVLTAQARYSSYIIAALPLLLFGFLWLTNYEYLSVLFQPGAPRIMLAAAAGGIVLGFFSMNKLAAVDA